MSDARAQLLRNTAAGLRLKAHQGQLAVAAARDLASILPRALHAAVEADLDSGALQKRWADALATARKDVPPDSSEEDVCLRALLALLAYQTQLATRITFGYVERTEGERRSLEGRASGIEEALGLLTHDEPAAKEA